MRTDYYKKGYNNGYKTPWRNNPYVPKPITDDEWQAIMQDSMKENTEEK